jgi:hypothetical protein
MAYPLGPSTAGPASEPIKPYVTVPSPPVSTCITSHKRQFIEITDGKGKRGKGGELRRTEEAWRILGVKGN